MNQPIILSVENNPVVAEILHSLTQNPATFKSAIAWADEMYSYDLNETDYQVNYPALLSYYSLGYTIFSTVQKIVKSYFGDFQSIDSFLDFACGYGRLTRFLIQTLPPEKIWVSDIYAEAVQFQTEYFGVNGMVSCLNPQDYHVNQRFDCIFAGSLFSHLPEQTFRQWLDQLYHLLQPTGLLIFTVLDEITMPDDVEMPPAGFLFSSDTSESRSLSKQDYGTTYVTETYLRQFIQQMSQDKGSVYRFPQGLGQYQDVYVVTQHPCPQFETLTLHQPPRGSLDGCYLTADYILCLNGWAADFNPGGKVEAVQILVNQQVVQQCQPGSLRQDVAKQFQRPDLVKCGWCCQVSLNHISLKDTILVKVINNWGLVWVMDAEVIEGLIARKRLELQLAATEAALQQAEAQIEAMERTMVWRVRRKWFKLLRGLG